MTKNKKLALKSGIQTNQILTNDDEVCIPHLSRILLAVHLKQTFPPIFWIFTEDEGDGIE